MFDADYYIRYHKNSIAEHIGPWNCPLISQRKYELPGEIEQTKTERQRQPGKIKKAATLAGALTAALLVETFFDTPGIVEAVSFVAAGLSGLNIGAKVIEASNMDHDISDKHNELTWLNEEFPHR
jgi:hypothetical protein